MPGSTAFLGCVVSSIGQKNTTIAGTFKLLVCENTWSDSVQNFWGNGQLKGLKSVFTSCGVNVQMMTVQGFSEALPVEGKAQVFSNNTAFLS